MNSAYQTFAPGSWIKSVNVRDFIQKNYAPYEGDDSFLASATDDTKQLWDQVSELMLEEREKGILDAETKVPSSIVAHGPGYIDKNIEKIVGFQTDAPLKRGIMPNGGIRVVKNALDSYGYELDPTTLEIFTNYRKTHNEGVFDAYTEDMRNARRQVSSPDCLMHTEEDVSSETTDVLLSMVSISSSRKKKLPRSSLKWIIWKRTLLSFVRN